MDTSRKTWIALGAAFLIQFVASLTSTTVLRSVWEAPEDISQTMRNIAANLGIFRIGILLDVITALGVVFLGVMLFTVLKKWNQTAALVALGFYTLEAALLAVSRMGAFSLMRFSQDYPASESKALLETLGRSALGSMDFAGSTLHVVVFGVGGIIFYALLYQSGLVPRVLSLWGLITVLPVLFGTLADMFGYTAPFALFIPYVPFEFVIGLWALIKGLRMQAVGTNLPSSAPA